ncbi:hypothetical protein HY967_02895 [Candidatus Jorgensenbacteria bacterium]|nr:hypothetical protein [Candidatus Jorgensenbacteria bacterium]
MVRPVNLDQHANDLLEQLAKEDNVTPDEFIQKLIEKEDRSRHIVKRPFEDEKRVRCANSNCQETEPREVEEYELGN